MTSTTDPGSAACPESLLLALLDEAASAVGAEPASTAEVTETVSRVIGRLFSPA